MTVLAELVMCGGGCCDSASRAGDVGGGCCDSASRAGDVWGRVL